MDVKVQKQIKIPTVLTEQVLVGLLNDVFSSCVFRSVPQLEEPPVVLGNSKVNLKKASYMLCLRWKKTEILVQSIVHEFSTFVAESGYSQDDVSKHGMKGTLISTGLFTAIHVGLKVPQEPSKLPTSLLNPFINAEINKGGNWAYMSCPVFLTAEKGDKEQNERRAKLSSLAKEQFEVISASTILCILWSLYRTESFERLHKLCCVLCNEFLEQYQGETDKLVYVLYLSQRMRLISEDKIEQIINSKFNNVTGLETLKIPDIAILTNILDCFKNSTTIATKICNVLYYHIEFINEESMVYLITGLSRLNFQFHQNDLFSKKLFSRLLTLFDKISSTELLFLLFNTLSLMTYDVSGYLNELLSKTITRLHMLSTQEIVTIGMFYAVAHNTARLVKLLSEADETTAQSIKDAISGKLTEPLSSHIYHCLDFVYRREAVNYKSQELHLLKMMHESLIYSSNFSFSAKLDDQFEYGKMWRESYALNEKIGKYNKSLQKTNVKQLETQANNPGFSNSYKMFFLNIIDDFCNNHQKYNWRLVDQMFFALFTFQIDISPMHEVMLINKGELIKKNVGFVQVQIVKDEDMTQQFKMGKEIMAWIRAKDGIDTFKIGHIVIEQDSFEALDYFKRLDSLNSQTPDHIEDDTDVQHETETILESEVVDSDKEIVESEVVNLELGSEDDEIVVSFENVKDEKVLKIEKKKSRSGEKKKHEEKEHKKDKHKAKKSDSKELKRSEFKEDGKKVKDEKDKVDKNNVEELIKMASKLDTSNLLPGNPIFDLLKLYTSKDSEESKHEENQESETFELLGKYSMNKRFTFAKSKEPKNDKKVKHPKEKVKSEEWVNLDEKNDKHSKDSKAKDKNKKKKFDVFYRIRNVNRFKVELEKRELQIVYKYVKIKS